MGLALYMQCDALMSSECDHHAKDALFTEIRHTGAEMIKGKKTVERKATDEGWKEVKWGRYTSWACPACLIWMDEYTEIIDQTAEMKMMKSAVSRMCGIARSRGYSAAHIADSELREKVEDAVFDFIRAYIGREKFQALMFKRIMSEENNMTSVSSH